MSNTLVVPETALMKSKYGTNESHSLMAASSAFLPRIQLVGSSSNLAKRSKVPQGTYAILRGKDVVVHQLGTDVNCLLFSWRPKAIRYGKGGEKTVVYFDPNSAAFKAIESEAEDKDSGCQFGPEYLIYVPHVKEFASFHFNNKTLRVAASIMLPLIGKPITFRVELIESKGNMWHGPVITGCSTPLQAPDNQEEFISMLTKVQEKFCNPKDSEAEEEAPPEETKRER